MGGWRARDTFLLCAGSLRGSSRRGVWRGRGEMILCRGGDVFRRNRLRLLVISVGGLGRGGPEARRTPIEWWSSGSP